MSASHTTKITHGPAPAGYVKLPEGAVIPRHGAIYWSIYEEWKHCFMVDQPNTERRLEDNIHVPASIPVVYPQPPVPEGFTIVLPEGIKKGDTGVCWNRHTKEWCKPTVARHDFHKEVPDVGNVYAVKDNPFPAVPAGWEAVAPTEIRKGVVYRYALRGWKQFDREFIALGGPGACDDGGQFILPVPRRYGQPETPSGFSIRDSKKVKKGEFWGTWNPWRADFSLDVLSGAEGNWDFSDETDSVIIVKTTDYPNCVPAGYRTLRTNDKQPEPGNFRVYINGQWNSADHSRYLAHIKDHDLVAVPLGYTAPEHYSFAMVGDTLDCFSLFWSTDERRWKRITKDMKVEQRHANRKCYAVLSDKAVVPSGYRILTAGEPCPLAYLKFAPGLPHKWEACCGVSGTESKEDLVAVPINPLQAGYRICLPGEIIGADNLYLALDHTWKRSTINTGHTNCVFPAFAVPVTASSTEANPGEQVIPEGYVRIKKGERVRKEVDLWLSYFDKGFIPSPCTHDPYDGSGTFIRRVETPAVTPPEGYVLLKKGDTIPEGSLWWHGVDRWLPATCIGAKAATFCRPVAQFAPPPSRPWRAADVPLGARVFRRVAGYGDSKAATILAVKDDGVLFEDNLTVAPGEAKLPLKQVGQGGIWYSFEALADNSFLLEGSEKPCRVEEQWHNPDVVTAEQVGVADGWRLLLKSEVDEKRRTGAQYWSNCFEKFEFNSFSCAGTGANCLSRNTIRTKDPLPNGVAGTA